MIRSGIIARSVGLRRTAMKTTRKASTRSKAVRQYMSRVAAMGCIACALDGIEGTPAELHHPRTNAGAGQRAADTDVIPLCPVHHRGTLHPAEPSIHLSRSRFIDQYGSEAELLALVREEVT